MEGVIEFAAGYRMHYGIDGTIYITMKDINGNDIQSFKMDRQTGKSMARDIIITEPMKFYIQG